MAARILDGKALAAELKATVNERVTRFREKQGFAPGLGVMLVGENPASKVYVKKKEEACAAVGIKSFHNEFPASLTEKEALEFVAGMNNDKRIHGILVQLPLPKQINEQKVLLAISPEKDADGFHPLNEGLLFMGAKKVVPATPKGIMKLIDSTGIALKGLHAVVVGRSNIVGKPVAMLLLERHCTVTLCHSRTKNLGEITRQADVLVAAVGKPGLVTKEMVKPGAVVIDVGINRTDAGLQGDVASDVAEVAGWLSPVPGGVGPMTVTCLLENTVDAAERSVSGGGSE